MWGWIPAITVSFRNRICQPKLQKLWSKTCPIVVLDHKFPISKFAWWLWLNIGYLKSSHGLSVVCKAIGSSIPNFTDFGGWHSNHQSRLVVKGIALLAWTQTFRDHIFFLWLVVDLPLWKMMEFVSWDDDIPNWMGKSIQIPWFQSPPTRYLINHY